MSVFKLQAKVHRIIQLAINNLDLFLTIFILVFLLVSYLVE